MKTQPALRLILAIIVVASLACSLGVPQGSRIKTGPAQKFNLHEPRPITDTVQNVNLTMAIGEFNLEGGTESLLDGEIRYNVGDWKPTVTRKDNSLTISQGNTDYTVTGIPGEDILNDWTVRLGNIPMTLSLRAGAYHAILDLSGLPLQRLDVRDGASHSEIRFDTLNPETMQSLSYSTGASEVTMLGLANANFTQMNFEGGAGDYTLDFSGDLKRHASVNIKVGLSDVQIVIPTGTAAQVFVDGGLGNVSVDDAWTKKKQPLRELRQRLPIDHYC